MDRKKFSIKNLYIVMKQLMGVIAQKLTLSLKLCTKTWRQTPPKQMDRASITTPGKLT